jgi:hypothetical protein
MVEHDVPSLAVAVAKDGEIIWEAGFGWADRERRIRATEHTMYSLASISKSITATGLMVLVERGLVDLDHPGASAVFSSAHDLARFGQFHLKNHLPEQRRILTDASIDEMQQPIALREDGSSYGLGWVVRTNERLSKVNHGGGMGGVSTTLALLPDQNAVVVVLSNMSSSVPNMVAREIFAVLAPDKVDAPGDGDPVGNEVALSEADLNGYAGGYDLGVMKATLTVDDGRLIAHTPQGSSPMVHVGDGRFYIEAMPSVRVSLEVEGGEMVLTLEDGDSTLRATRGPAGPLFSPLPGLEGTWSGRVDTYQGGKPVVLVIRGTGEAYIQLGGQPWTVLNGAELSDGYLKGMFAGDIGTEDANRRPYTLRLEVKLRGETLNGSLIAQSLPGRWIGNALTHWIELDRAAGENGSGR